jgi:hypothetical protein
MLVRRSLLKQTIALVLLAVLTSPIVPLSILISSGGPIVWSDQQEMIFGLSAISAPLILFGAILIGIPALVVARKLGMTESPVRLGLVGALTGAIAAPTVFRSFFFSLESAVFAQLMLTGALVGVVGGCFWWRLIEKHRIEVVEHD